MGVARILLGGNTFSKNFSKNPKKFQTYSKKFQKIFKKFSKNISKMFRKFLKTFLRKLLKMHYFSIFSKNVNKQCVNFWGLDEKHKLLGIFQKILKFFDENSIEK